MLGRTLSDALRRQRVPNGSQRMRVQQGAVRPVARDIRGLSTNSKSSATERSGGIRYNATPRRPEGKFHVTESAEDDIEEDLPIESTEEMDFAPPTPQRGALDAPVQKYITLRRGGDQFEYRGTEIDTGRKVYRKSGIPVQVPVKRKEKIISFKTKRSTKLFEPIVVETPLRDRDMDKMDPSLTSPAGPAFDFSKLSSQSSDIEELVEVVSKATGTKFSPQHRDAVVQAFESWVRQQSVSAMDPATHSIGRELLELHVLNALTSTYPYLPPEGIIKLTQNASSRESLARALLDLKLEPLIKLIPSVPLSTFEDPSGICLELAANAYTSLLGVLYLEKGFDFTSEFIFRTLTMQRVTPESLRSLQLLDGVSNSKTELHKLLHRMRFPMPSYEMENVTDDRHASNLGYGNRYTAIVKSGHQIIGRGQGDSKTRAEARAAANALLLHWSKEVPL